MLLVLLPYAIVGYASASVSNHMNSPGYQLTLDVTEQYSSEDTLVCWDNQTHSIFEALAPEFAIAGRLSPDKLYEGYENGRVLVMTNRCQWFEVISEDLPHSVIETYTGNSPVWSKAPEIKSFVSVK